MELIVRHRAWHYYCHRDLVTCRNCRKGSPTSQLPIPCQEGPTKPPTLRHCSHRKVQHDCWGPSQRRHNRRILQQLQLPADTVRTHWISLYRQPNSKTEHTEELCSAIRNIAKTYQSLVIWIGGNANLTLTWTQPAIQLRAIWHRSTCPLLLTVFDIVAEQVVLNFLLEAPKPWTSSSQTIPPC